MLEIRHWKLEIKFMSFPIAIFLYLYYAFLVGWALFSLVGVYHMLKFGFKSFTSFFITLSYLAVSFIILTASWSYTSRIDWQERLSFFEGFDSATKFIDY